MTDESFNVAASSPEQCAHHLAGLEADPDWCAALTQGEDFMRTAIICGALALIASTAAAQIVDPLDANHVLPFCKSIFEQFRSPSTWAFAPAPPWPWRPSR